MATSIKLIFSILILDGPMKDQVFSGKNITACFKEAQNAGFYAGTIRTRINGISFPLAACESLTALVKNKKGAWILTPNKN